MKAAADLARHLVVTVEAELPEVAVVVNVAAVAVAAAVVVDAIVIFDQICARVLKEPLQQWEPTVHQPAIPPATELLELTPVAHIQVEAKAVLKDRGNVAEDEVLKAAVDQTVVAAADRIRKELQVLAEDLSKDAIIDLHTKLAVGMRRPFKNHLGLIKSYVSS